MTPKRICEVYFSGTGTTQTIIHTLSAELGAAFGAAVEDLSFTLPAARQKDYTFGENDLVLVGLPTYAGRVPNLLLPFLKEKLHGNGALAIPVVLYGNRNYDDSLMELRGLLQDGGFACVAGAAFIGEHSFSRKLGAGRPDANDLAIAKQFAAEAAAKITALTDAPAEPVAVGGQDPIRPYYTPRDRYGKGINILKVKPKTNEKCTKCGLCASICPMGAIDPADPTNVPGICIKCGGCEKKCPVGAKYYDDPGYLYHMTELEEVYGPVRKEPELFL